MTMTKQRAKKPIDASTAVENPPAVSDDRVLRHATTRTLNGKGELQYCVGVDAKGEPRLRILENTGGSGSFSDDWISFKAIQAALDRAPKDQPLGVRYLFPLFRGKSSNCSYFTAAILVSEGLLKSSEKRRLYDRVDPATWLAELTSLADGRAGGGKPARGNAKDVNGAKPKKSNKRAST